MLSLVRQFSFILLSLLIFIDSPYADMGLFRLQGRVFFTSDTIEMKNRLLEFKKCSPSKTYVESYLGMDMKIAANEKSPHYIANLINYQKLIHHSVINSSLKMETDAKEMFKKCFSVFSKEALALSLSEYYLQKVVRDLSKVSEMRIDLDKAYSHELLSSKSSPSVWKKK